MEGKTIYQPFEIELSIRSLNPDEAVEVWVPYAVSTYLSGLVWISCSIVSKKKNDKILTHQKDRNTGFVRKYEANEWGSESYIFDKLEYEQARTNKYLFILSVITATHGIFGLNNIVKGFLQLLSNLFLSIGHFISGTVHT